MKTWVRKTLSVGVLAAGALLFAPGAAHADVQNNGGNVGILNGNQLAVPVSVPVNISGNSLGILGIAGTRSVSANQVEHGRRGGSVQRNGGNVGIANGNQAYLPISVPVNLSGNALAVAGAAQSGSVSANSINGRRVESAKIERRHRGGDSVQSNGANFGLLNGNQLYAPISVPINACGNSLAILGGAFSQSICQNNVNLEHGRRGGSVQRNGGNVGIANGNQLYAPISLPVNLSGNSAALLGVAGTRSASVNNVESGTERRGDRDGSLQSNGGNFGIGNGNQLAVPVSIPLNVCGNALGILGAAQSSSACVNNVGGVFGDDSWGDDEDDTWGHGGKGHGHGHGGHGHGDNAGDDGDVDDDKYLNDGDVADDDDNDDVRGNGDYTDEEPAAEEPTDEAPAAGYGAVSPATGSTTKATGGRAHSAKTEAGPVSGITQTVGGLGQLGLLNTLR